jgi:hypothetical protein
MRIEQQMALRGKPGPASHRERSRVLLFTCLVMLASSLVQASDSARLIVGGARGTAGTTVSIPVLLRSAMNVVALQADILFDTNSLAPGLVSGGGVSANHTVASSQPAAGTQRLLLYSLNNNVLSNGVLANLTFAVAPGTYPNALRLGVTNVTLVTASSAPVLTTNIPGVIVINPVFIHPGGDVNFFLSVVPNESYMVQGSTDLTQWLDLGRVDSPSAIIEFTDTNAPVFPYRFYRAVSVPLP